jgi:hypothetical protein
LRNNRFFILIIILSLSLFTVIESFAQSDSVFIKADTTLPELDSTYTSLDSLLSVDTSYIQQDSLNTSDTIITGVKPPPLPKEIQPVLSKADSLRVAYFVSTIDSLKLETFHSIDTSILRFHQYDPLEYGNLFYSTLSNIGLAHKNFIYTPHISAGYNLNNLTFDKYMYFNSEVKYYQQIIPFTDLHYTMGPKKEQNFYLVFSRELFRGFSIGVDLGIVQSPGEYANSKSDNNKVFFTGQYFTRNKRYGVIANYLRNKVEVEENGGIVNDSIFEYNIQPDRSVIKVNLESDKNLVIQSGFYVEQYFNLLKPRPADDSIKRKIDAGNISYAIHYQRNQKKYSGDPLDEFYDPYSPPIDSTNTFDSLYQMRFRNTFKWSNQGYNTDKISEVFYLSFGAHYDFIEQTLPYDSLKTTFNQIIPFAGISLKLFKSTHLKGNASLVFGDYNGGDFNIHAELDQYLGNEYWNIGKLHVMLDLASQTPSWFFSEYQSNRFRWSNDFKKENFLKLTGSYQYKFAKAGFNFSTLNNYTYLNDSVQPQQYEPAFTVLQVFAQGNIPIKKFGIDTRLNYQVSGNSEVLRLPMFTAVMNLYFRSDVFKKAATLQAGFQLNYFTSYYADAYMPELRRFYIQNEKKIGNYVYADVYLTLQIKTATIFVKYSHINSFLGYYNYYLAPHYPARDGRFYFGAAWRFHD